MNQKRTNCGAVFGTPLLLFLLLCCPLPIRAAEIFSWVDSEGFRHFTNRQEHAPKSAKPVLIRWRGESEPNQRTLTYQEGSSGGIYLMGKINTIPVRFQLDTGADLVVIPEKIAAKAGVPLDSATPVTVHTANGTIEATKVMIETVSLNGVVRHNVEAVVHDIGETDEFGLLGMSFLGNYQFTINRDRKQVTFRANHPPKPKTEPKKTEEKKAGAAPEKPEGGKE